MVDKIILTDEEMIEKIAADISWDGFWFKCHNFFINAYVTLIIWPLLIGLRLESISFTLILCLAISYDVLWHKKRFPIRYQKRHLIRIVLTYLGGVKGKDQKISYQQIIHFALISIFILTQAFQINALVLLISVFALIVLIIAEYYFIIKYMTRIYKYLLTWPTELKYTNAEDFLPLIRKRDVDGILRDYANGSYSGTNKYFVMIQLFLLYGPAFLFLALLPRSELYFPSSLAAISGIFVTVFLALIWLFCSGLFVRVVIVARSYVQSSKNI